jgi:hypothetical protein
MPKLDDNVVIVPITQTSTSIIAVNQDDTVGIQSSQIIENEIIVPTINLENKIIPEIFEDGTTVVCCNESQSGGIVEEALSSRVLKSSLIADEVISALRIVYQTSSNHAALADYQNGSKKDAVGISLTSANIGGSVDVLFFGRVEDSFFNFPLNDNLFLGNNGIITNVTPVSDYSVRIGKSLGAGAIFINIERPIIL